MFSTISLSGDFCSATGAKRSQELGWGNFRLIEWSRKPDQQLTKGGRLELEAAAARAGVVLNPVVEVETLSVAARLVEEGLGLTVHFAAVVQDEIEAGRLVAIPIEGLRLRRVLARASARSPSRATEVLIDILRAVVQERVDAGRWPHAMLDH